MSKKFVLECELEDLQNIRSALNTLTHNIKGLQWLCLDEDKAVQSEKACLRLKELEDKVDRAIYDGLHISREWLRTNAFDHPSHPSNLINREELGNA